MSDMVQAYEEVRDRLIGLVLSLDPASLAMSVPACPGWSVQDVLAHHVGAVVDATTGNAPEFKGPFNIFEQWRDKAIAQRRDALTGREVIERRGRSVRALTEEWLEVSPELFALMRSEKPFPEPFPDVMGFALINDAVVHEGDIREALELERAPDGPAMRLALASYGFSLDHRIRSLGLSPLVLSCEGKDRRLGDGETAGATVIGDRYHLVRMMAGRYTAEQIAEFSWQGDLQSYLGVLSEYGRGKSG